MTLETYVAYLIVVGIFFATPPGPSQILMVSNSIRYGWRKSSATIVGDLSANSIQMVAAGYGVAVLISNSAAAMSIIKWGGVVYLIYIGIKTFRAIPESLDKEVTSSTSNRQLFFQGFVTSASNPKGRLRNNTRLLNKVSGCMMISAGGLLATKSMDVR